MATSDKTKPSDEVPADLMPLIRASGLLNQRQLDDVRARVLEGSYPFESRSLAQKLVRDKILTEYQARRLLSNKPGGMIVGRYVIMDRLGSGSMGRVYKAHHQLMDRVVALKIIAPEIVTNARIISRFQREMRLVGRLDHEHVVRAFDADQIGDVLYIVMEYVPGRSLGQIYRAEGPMAPTLVAGYAAQAAQGLAHAHAQGIVHRDVKPSNLLLGEGGMVKVLDLGLGVLMEADEQASFATADGIAVGTIDYMSPEQACGKEVDGRSDIYSLGCTMYHLMTGKLPFPGETPIDRLGRRLGGSPVPINEIRPDVPPAIAKIMDRMMAPKPSDRFQKSEELCEALESLRKPKGSTTKKPARAAGADVAAASPAPPVIKTVSVRPDYPAWFRPLAELAEASPYGALAVLIVVLIVVFGAGFAACLMLG